MALSLKTACLAQQRVPCSRLASAHPAGQMGRCSVASSAWSLFGRAQPAGPSTLPQPADPGTPPAAKGAQWLVNPQAAKQYLLDIGLNALKIIATIFVVWLAYKLFDPQRVVYLAVTAFLKARGVELENPTWIEATTMLASLIGGAYFVISSLLDVRAVKAGLDDLRKEIKEIETKTKASSDDLKAAVTQQVKLQYDAAHAQIKAQRLVQQAAQVRADAQIEAAQARADAQQRSIETMLGALLESKRGWWR